MSTTLVTCVLVMALIMKKTLAGASSKKKNDIKQVDERKRVERRPDSREIFAHYYYYYFYYSVFSYMHMHADGERERERSFWSSLSVSSRCWCCRSSSLL